MLRNKHLRYEDRIRTLENQMVVSKNTEKQLEATLKQEVKTLTKSIKTVESSIPVQLHKKCKPIEDKVAIMLETIDDLENEIEEIKSNAHKFAIQAAQMTDEQNEEFLESTKKLLSSPSKPTEKKQSRVSIMNQLLETELEGIKKMYDSRFESIEEKLSKQSYTPSTGYEKFLLQKDQNKLFEDINHKERKEEANTELHKKEYSKKVIQNDMVLYQLYSRYNEMVGELDVYKEKIMENLRFEEKTPLFYTPVKQRPRANSVEFKVQKMKNDILGKAKLHFIPKPDAENELKKWNFNFNDRLEEIEHQFKSSVNKTENKFNDTIRNRGLLLQEVRILENTVNTMRQEMKELKEHKAEKQTAMDGTESDLQSSAQVKQLIEDKFKSVKKNFENQVNDYANDIKSLELQLVKFEKDMTTKVDKTYMETFEASLNVLIKQSKGNNSITNVLKNLSDSMLVIKDRMEFNNEKYESAMEDLYKKVSKYDDESQKFMDEMEEIDRFKAKNKVLQSKMDKLFILLKQHAFDPDSLAEDIEGKIDIEFKDIAELAKATADGKTNKAAATAKLDIASKKQIEAIHAMYIHVESEFEELKRRMDEKDYVAEMVEQSAIDIAQGKKPQEMPVAGSARDRNIHRIMNVEFMGMKQLIGKHQLVLNKLDQRVRDLEEYKSMNNLSKFNQEQQKQSDALQAYIKEADEYNSELFRKVWHIKFYELFNLDPRHAPLKAKL